MSGHLSMKTADKINKQQASLQERGLSEDSYFVITFQDDSQITEHDCNWTEISTRKRVAYQGNTKTVLVCNEKVKNIHIFHGDKDLHVDVPNDCEVYQAIRSETIFNPTGSKKNQIIGRVVGLIKNDEVISEYVINVLQGVVSGWRN